MKYKPVASVIIRCKNEERWLSSCLQALRHQSLSPIEIILVDNESTDSSVSIALDYECNIIPYDYQPFNFSQALNLGVSFASSM